MGLRGLHKKMKIHMQTHPNGYSCCGPARRGLTTTEDTYIVTCARGLHQLAKGPKPSIRPQMKYIRKQEGGLQGCKDRLGLNPRKSDYHWLIGRVEMLEKRTESTHYHAFRDLEKRHKAAIAKARISALEDARNLCILKSLSLSKHEDAKTDWFRTGVKWATGEWVSWINSLIELYKSEGGKP